MHMPKDKFISEIVTEKVKEQNKKFFRSTESVSGGQKKLLYRGMSASVGNFQQHEENTAHLPLDIFK